ncbi:HPr kinase/phosphorylase [Polycladidibacter stylochi]|uniref:HPr kinase/phosphorylase n=1 Tax=Polycladidibacter stylochi TaxID=1807766 RepID=UPI00082A49EA|nr:hypothetical protein [Pseudovibrio stylochi]
MMQPGNVLTFQQDPETQAVHATALAIGCQGILIRGNSGSGKSSLALSLIKMAQLNGRYAALIADDRCYLTAINNHLLAQCPKPLLGLLELRGLGLIKMPFLRQAPIHFLVDLTHKNDIERFPEQDNKHKSVLGITLPYQQLEANNSEFAARLLLQALEAVSHED